MEDFKSCALIYNPVATKFNEETLKNAYHMLDKYYHGMDIKFCKSEYPGHVVDLIKEENERDLIITLGGDGTVGEAYKAFDEIDQHAIYSHLSVGTTNDMAANFNLSKKKPLLSLEKLLTIGEVKDIDTLKMDDKTFAYVSAFGYLAHVPFITKAENKKKYGSAAYVYAARKHITDVPHLDITYEIDGVKKDTNCILGLITNFSESANVLLHPYADPTDGLFEVGLLKHVTPSLFLKVFPEYLKGEIDLRKYSEHVEIIQTDNIKFHFNTLPKYEIDNDGDEAKSNLFETGEVSYKTGKKIKILMPNKQKDE